LSNNAYKSFSHKGIVRGMVKRMKTKIFAFSLMMLLALGNVVVLVATSEGNQPAWPTSWILTDTDPDESESSNDYRDVQYAYYYYDDVYLYFRLECFTSPNFTVDPASRYKWFIDTDDHYNMAWQGSNVYDAEFLLFVEHPHKLGGDGIGNVYLLNDGDDDGVISDDWHDYSSIPGPILDKSVAGYRIVDNCIDVYVSQAVIGNPIYSYFTWSTDQEDPNLDSTSTTDRSDSYWNENLSKADLSIVTSDSCNPVSPGAPLTYTLEVTNHGPHDAVNVCIKNTLPDAVTFIDIIPAQNGITGQTVWWNFTSLAVGDSELITINVTIKDNTTPSVITNFAMTYSDTYDPMPGNNEARVDTTISLDTDGDGIPDCVDPDDDNDGYNDDVDAFPLDPSEWVDADGDGIGDNADSDDDGDGYYDVNESACGSDPLNASSIPDDFDGDFIPDCVDTDDDNDGVPDNEDAFPYDPTENQDTDSDGIGDNTYSDDDSGSKAYTPHYDDPTENNPPIVNTSLGEPSLGIGYETITVNASYNPLSQPIITGPSEGYIDIVYNFSIILNDSNIDIKFKVNWGNGTVNESDYLAAESVWMIHHKWIQPGQYTISVTAFDGKTNTTTSHAIKIYTPNTPGPNIAEPGNVLFVLLSLLALMFLPLFFLLGKRRKDEEKEDKK
jgi:uncharacterized repeat protein (TIGR01451 family)